MNAQNSLRIAWAAPDDAERLVPLFVKLYKHDVPEAPVPTDETMRQHIALLLAPATPHKLAVAWRDDGRAVGLVAAATFVSVSDPRPDRWKQMEIKELFVRPDARSAGVGDALMQWVENSAVAAGVCRIDWHVKSDNDRGIAFYERFGAHIVEERLSMRKTLRT